MIEDPTEALMWAKIDGSISAGDEARLESLLGGDAEAREFFEELTRFNEILGVVDELEPPTALRQRIEGAIDFDRYAAREVATSPSFFRRWLPAPLNFSMVGAAAAGLVVGIVGYHLVATGPALEDSELTGTMKPMPEVVSIAVDGVRGRVSFEEHGGLAVSRIELASQREIEMQLDYAGSSVGFEAMGDPQNPLHDISVKGNSIIVNNLGDAEYIATFEKAQDIASPLRVRILSGDDLLLEEEIRPDRSR